MLLFSLLSPDKQGNTSEQKVVNTVKLISILLKSRGINLMLSLWLLKHQAILRGLYITSSARPSRINARTSSSVGFSKFSYQSSTDLKGCGIAKHTVRSAIP